MMEDSFEKKLKEFLPYIIIIGAVYLLAPVLLVLTKSAGVLNQIIYIGVFPLTALACGTYYGYKKENDFFLSLVAPIIYIPSMLIYGNLRDSVLNSLIFLISYFICGYIGLTIGDMLKGKNSGSSDAKEKADRTHSRKRVPRRVKTVDERKSRTEIIMEENDIEMPQSFDTHEHIGEVETTFDTTADDIDSILAEIHSRREE
ncbi:MAG: hypothetical protein IJD68_02990 [Ruminococcus sp.]|nr:hypothetical protein [Ruminococcus sp.]